jgi:hypothetical protein
VRSVLAQIAHRLGFTRPSGASSLIAKPWPISECLRAVRLGFEFQPFVHLLTEDV